MDHIQDRLGQSNSAPSQCNSNPTPPYKVGGVQNGLPSTLVDVEGNLRFHVACANGGYMNVHIPWVHRTLISKDLLQKAKGTLDAIELDAKFDGGRGTGLLIHMLAEFASSTIKQALTFLPTELPRYKETSIFVLCSFGGSVSIFRGRAVTCVRTMEQITKGFLVQLDRDRKYGGHHSRQLLDNFVAEATASLLGGEAKLPAVFP